MRVGLHVFSIDLQVKSHPLCELYQWVDEKSAKVYINALFIAFVRTAYVCVLGFFFIVVCVSALKECGCSHFMGCFIRIVAVWLSGEICMLHCLLQISFNAENGCACILLIRWHNIERSMQCIICTDVGVFYTYFWSRENATFTTVKIKQCTSRPNSWNVLYAVIVWVTVRFYCLGKVKTLLRRVTHWHTWYSWYF